MKEFILASKHALTIANAPVGSKKKGLRDNYRIPSNNCNNI